ncbi:hypothetical protein WS63_08235 [Burkholderia stagnalis]|nr:hypothetical protein WS63_08235 [Burkholderia stagnalis]
MDLQSVGLQHHVGSAAELCADVLQNVDETFIRGIDRDRHRNRTTKDRELQPFGFSKLAQHFGRITLPIDSHEITVDDDVSRLGRNRRQTAGARDITEEVIDLLSGLIQLRVQHSTRWVNRDRRLRTARNPADCDE